MANNKRIMHTLYIGQLAKQKQSLEELFDDDRLDKTLNKTNKNKNPIIRLYIIFLQVIKLNA